jgi:hypothetical protein
VAASYDEDDVDGGDTSLVSPAWDLSGFYAVTVSWRRWLSKDDADAVDRMVVDVSVDDGASWVTLDELTESSATADAEPAWTRGNARLDEVVAPAPETRLRFRALDAAPDHVVEAAVDDVLLIGHRLRTDGDVGGVSVSGSEQTVISWSPVPGGSGAVYDVARGDLAELGGSVDLGPLTCIEDDSSDTSTEGSPDADVPPAGQGFFYVVRFQLGLSTGAWGWGSGGGERSGSGGCS